MKKLYFLLLAACIVLGSCTAEESASNLLKLGGSSSQAPVFLNSRAVSENEIEFKFSQPVKITSINFEPVISVASIENGSTVRVYIEESQEPGRKFTVDLLAEDEKKNSINVLASLRARNNRMPELVINEICTENSKPKTEFIEFRTITAGNLGAMRVFIKGNTNAAKETIYEFPPIEVKENEYIVLHLRKVEDGCIDEYGANLSLSGGTRASDTARDIWIPGNSKLIHKEASAVYLMDQDDNVLTAVMISNSIEAWWAKDYFAETAELLYKKGAWKSIEGKICSPADAINSTGTTNTRTICRDETAENTNTAENWYITAASGVTPGGKNNEKRYSP